MDNGQQFIVPANSKKSQLILSYFTVSDLVILGTGVAISIISFLVKEGEDFVMMIILSLPALIAAFLVLPLPPYYHNVRQFIGNMNRFLFGTKKYYWRGWCARDERE